MKKTRQANLELLRLISMIMVVTMHVINHGGMIDLAQKGTLAYYVAWTLFGVSFVSINLYILISGYFLAESRFSLWRLVKIELQVFFYAFGILALFWIFGDVEKDIKYLVYCVTPIISDFYWFATMYVGMYLLSPLLNRLAKALTKRQLQCVLVLLFLQFSVWTNVFYYTSGMNIAGGVSISWFLVMYLAGAYIKLYYVPDQKATKWLLAGCGLALLIPVSRYLIEAVLSTPLGNIGFLEDLMWGYSVFYQYNSILAVLGACCLFIAFLNIKLKDGPVSKGIVLAASASFGVYLIHDHYYIREILWKKINPWAWMDDWYLIPCILLTIVGIYVGCMAVELLRQKLCKPLENRLKPVIDKADNKLRQIWQGESK